MTPNFSRTTTSGKGKGCVEEVPAGGFHHMYRYVSASMGSHEWHMTDCAMTEYKDSR